MRRGLLAFVGALCVAPLANGLVPLGGSSATSSSAAIQFPRFAVYLIGGSQDYAENTTALTSYLSHMDMVGLGGGWEGSAGGYGYNRGTLVNAIQAGDGKITPVVAEYQAFDRMGYNGYTAGGAPNNVVTPIWYGQVNAMANYWLLHWSVQSGFIGSSFYTASASVTASIGTTGLMTVSAVGSGTLGLGPITWSGAPAGVQIISAGSGTGSTGTYQTSYSGTAVGSTTITFNGWVLFAYNTNPVDLGSAGRDSNGNAMEAAGLDYAAGYYWNGSTADAAPNMGAIFHDNFGGLSQGSIKGDYLQNGTAVVVGNTSVYPNVFAGYAEGVNWWRSNMAGKLLIANQSWVYYLSDNSVDRVFQRPTSVLGALATTSKVDAYMLEGFTGETWADEYFGGVATAATNAAYLRTVVVHPELDLLNNEGLDANGECTGSESSVGAGIRYHMALAWIVDNGLATYMSTRNVSGGYYETLDWPDWISVNPATGVALSYASSTQTQLGQYRRWMGVAIDPPQTAAARNGGVGSIISYTGGPNVFVRRFRAPNNRIVLVIANESTNFHTGNTSAVITLPAGTWQKLTGSGTNYGSNTSIDNGATGLTGVTIPTGDADILLQ